MTIYYKNDHTTSFCFSSFINMSYKHKCFHIYKSWADLGQPTHSCGAPAMTSQLRLMWRIWNAPSLNLGYISHYKRINKKSRMIRSKSILVAFLGNCKYCIIEEFYRKYEVILKNIIFFSHSSLVVIEFVEILKPAHLSTWTVKRSFQYNLVKINVVWKFDGKADTYPSYWVDHYNITINLKSNP